MMRRTAPFGEPEDPFGEIPGCERTVLRRVSSIVESKGDLVIRRALTASLFVLTVACGAQAQHGQAPVLVTKPPAEAAQFAFLVGQWEIVAEPYVAGLAARIHGSPKFPGTWKAWPGLDGWGIEDEVRLTDASGNPAAFTHTVRAYDANAARWNLSALDVYRARLSTATGVWRNGEMHVESRGTDVEGRAFVSRGRFHAISPNAFRFVQDRSFDDGATWTEGFLKIEAKRVAATASR